jgi:hypothetical protein
VQQLVFQLRKFGRKKELAHPGKVVGVLRFGLVVGWLTVHTLEIIGKGCPRKCAVKPYELLSPTKFDKKA